MLNRTRNLRIQVVLWLVVVIASSIAAIGREFAIPSALRFWAGIVFNFAFGGALAHAAWAEGLLQPIADRRRAPTEGTEAEPILPALMRLPRRD